MECKYAKIVQKTDSGKLESICVCGHPMYESKLQELADALLESGKILIPNKECQFVRDLDCTMCPLYKENS